MPTVSVFIITKNEEENILRCLESVKPIADEIVVVDDFSTDRTLEICKQEGCRVFEHKFTGYAAQKQFALEQTTCDWVLSLDADEVLTPKSEIELLEWKTRTDIEENGYKIPFDLIYLGHLMKFSGTCVAKLRLFCRTKGRFMEVTVHEDIILEGKIGRMKYHILHYSYRDLSHHIQKLNTYTSDAARGYIQKNRRFSHFQAVLKFPVNFFIFYFLRLGILDGFPGFMWSLLASFYGTLKIAKTIELQKKK
ncbi:MAG: glycosyltransferase family 2 protein [Bacteroidota bacterium]|nr:glycosyltransferase family 2 protein [Bacteroidota bacterium]